MKPITATFIGIALNLSIAIWVVWTMFTAAQFTIAKCWKQPKCPPVSEWIKKLWYIYTTEYYAAERKEGLLPFCDSVDGTGEHYAR